MKRGSLPSRSCATMHADRPAARRRAARRARCGRRGAGPTPGRPRGRRASESTRSARRRSSTRPLFEPARSSCRPTISPHRSPSAASIRSVPSSAGSAIVTRRAPISPRRRRAISSSSRASSISLASARPDLVQRLELVGPRGRRLVQARILDRDRGLARERLDELLVAGGERALLLLGQVEVPEGTAAQQDRHAEEAAHRRMVGREADRARIVRDRLEPQRAGVGDQGAEDAAAARQGADLRPPCRRRSRCGGSARAPFRTGRSRRGRRSGRRSGRPRSRRASAGGRRARAPS